MLVVHMQETKKHIWTHYQQVTGRGGPAAAEARLAGSGSLAKNCKMLNVFFNKLYCTATEMIVLLQPYY